VNIFYNLICTIERYWQRFLFGFVVLVIIPVIAAVSLYLYKTEWRHTVLKDIQARGELVVVTRNAPTTYYEGQNGEYAGLEYDLAVAFAEYIGVKVRFVVRDGVEEILNSIDQGEADVAAAGLTRTGLDSEKYLFGPSYQSVHEKVVCRRNHKGVPASIEELAGRQLVIPAGRYAEQLGKLKREYPWLEWEQDPASDTELLLWKVWKREIECTVSDSNIVAMTQRYYPELIPALDLNDYSSLAWVLPDNGKHLQAVMLVWLEDFIEAGGLNDLMERYYGHLESFDYVDTRRFRNKIYQTLPKYRRWFMQAAKKYGLDWKLLAAISYQESHWNPRARSPTGVRGMMMLTLPTARQLGIGNRLDAKTNIFAGARYLAQLRARLPSSIQEPERTWMLLAAYNMGYGHLSDARLLAKRMGMDPDRWIDLEQVLPLLSQRKYYRRFKHGYARGYEALQYVERVRVYNDILRQK